MNLHYRRALFALGLWLLALPALAQTESDEQPLLDVKNGVSFSQKDLFLLNLRFRMQNRAGFNTEGGNTLDIAQWDARVRRLRIRFDGYVLSPKTTYYIQLSFSRSDQDLESRSIAETIRDAMIYYRFNDHFYMGFGQSKLPGNRQRVVSSGNLQFADRSQANGLFTLDRDFGWFTYYTWTYGNNAQLQFKTAISSGDGRNALPVNEGLDYTGRVEWLPLGTFTKGGDYSEGDLEFEPKPKLSLAASWSYNQRASRTGGQLGDPLYDFRDIRTYIVDMMFKYQGWMLSGEFLDRHVDNPFTQNEPGDVRYVLTGWGLNMQLSKMLTKKTELASRYTRTTPSTQFDGLERINEEVWLG